jgi:hypothetical protein
MILITLEVLTPDRVMRMAAGVIVFLTILSGVLLHFWEIDALHYLPGISLCPFHVITGMACPGCGMTRAFLTLGQLKLQQAVTLNPFAIPLFSVMILYLWLGYIPRILHQKALLRFSIPAVLTLWIFHLLGK